MFSRQQTYFHPSIPFVAITRLFETPSSGAGVSSIAPRSTEQVGVSIHQSTAKLLPSSHPQLGSRARHDGCGYRRAQARPAAAKPLSGCVWKRLRRSLVLRIQPPRQEREREKPLLLFDYDYYNNYYYSYPHYRGLRVFARHPFVSPAYTRRL